MEQENSNHPFEDLAYGRTFLPIYAILAGQDAMDGTGGMGAPLIPPVLFWKDSDKQVKPQ